MIEIIGGTERRKTKYCSCAACEGREVLERECPCEKCKGCGIHIGKKHITKEYVNGYCEECYEKRRKEGKL